MSRKRTRQDFVNSLPQFHLSDSESSDDDSEVEGVRRELIAVRQKVAALKAQLACMQREEAALADALDSFPPAYVPSSPVYSPA